MKTENMTDQSIMLDFEIDFTTNTQAILINLAKCKDLPSLFEAVLIEAQRLTNADGGTLYVISGEDEQAKLKFSVMSNQSLGIRLNAYAGDDIKIDHLNLYEDGEPNTHNVATFVALNKQLVNIKNVYLTDKFDFSGTKKFDRNHGYRSESFMTVPLLDHNNEIIAVLQLINAKDDLTDEIIAFSSDNEALVEAMAGYTATALENQILLHSHKELLDAFIQSLAKITDVRSSHTSAHCQRLPVLTELIAQAACEDKTGYFQDFSLNQDQWYELRVAAWMHDCGKLATPDSIINKATKLNTLLDGIDSIKARFAALISNAVNQLYKQAIKDGKLDSLESNITQIKSKYADDYEFLALINKGGEFMSDDKKLRVKNIAKYQYIDTNDVLCDMLSSDEITNLCITRGTINEEERKIINRHIDITIDVLEALPFPKNLRKVPEYAGGHHERMDGKGYPKGLTRDQLSIPARIMGVADIFEALTAKERPYKKPMPLSEAFSILQRMKNDGHIDPDVFDLFLRSGKWLGYAKEHMLEFQLDVSLDEVENYI
ncbi:MAG: GAF domain-containing protein [Saccharospirillaceae bacterium]|nr:GAF domain-containing protein [Pseudomonadales bacterium]NRB80253.1 GAF domain-containing protein [Saccharospirillaceae bacterium]